MRIAITNEEEISRLNTLLNEIEWLSKQFRSGFEFEDIVWEDYKQLSSLPRDSAEEFLKVLSHKVAGNHFQRILFNCSTMLINCADLTIDILDFNPKIKAGFEAIDFLKEIVEVLSSENQIIDFKQRAKEILDKVPSETQPSEN